jgi:hypothetical protein
VSEADGGDAVALLEVDLDQRLPRVAVPGPRERQEGRRLDLDVGAVEDEFGLMPRETDVVARSSLAIWPTVRNVSRLAVTDVTGSTDS